eukprot:6983971-Pyramimonas_sp.AAC.1
MRPQMAENEAGAAARAPQFGPPAASPKPRTKGRRLRGLGKEPADAHSVRRGTASDSNVQSQRFL